MIYYSGCGASTGQTLWHDPQSKQASASISYLPAPSLIAPTGHSDSHAPQAIHASVIMYAIVVHPLKAFYCFLLYTNDIYFINSYFTLIYILFFVLIKLYQKVKFRKIIYKTNSFVLLL